MSRRVPWPQRPPDHPPLRVLHAIIDLRTGGTQRVLTRLADGLAARGHEQRVLVLGPLGPPADDLSAFGVPADHIPLDRPDGLPRLVGTLARLAGAPARRGSTSASATPAHAREGRRSSTWRPDVVQTWLAHADVLVGGLARALRLAPVAWNLRGSGVRPEGASPSLRALWGAAPALSRTVPSAIVACGPRTAQAHQARGLPARRMRIIPNGYPPSPEGPPTAEERAQARERFGLPQDAFVIAQVARWHPMKGHEDLLEAVAALGNQATPTPWVLLAGRGCEPQGSPATAHAQRLGIAGRTRALGDVRDVRAVYAAADVIASPSRWGEGFPNAVAEAMGAARPVVATDVGDSATVLGPDQPTLPPADVPALTARLQDLMAMSPEQRERLGHAGAQRLAERFSVDRMVDAYEALYVMLRDGTWPWAQAGRPGTTTTRSDPRLA